MSIYAKNVDGTSFSTREIIVLLIRSISSAVSPDPKATRSRQFGVKMSDGECASELMTMAAPASRASDTILPFPRPWQGRAEISRRTPFAAARRTSSSEMMPGMRQDVNTRLDPRPVGSQRDGLADRLAVQQHEARAELARAAHQPADLARRHVRELHTGDDADLHERLGLPGELDERGDQVIQVGGVRVVGDPDGAVAGVLGPADQLRGAQLAVAQERVRVKVDHHCPPAGLARMRK